VLVVAFAFRFFSPRVRNIALVAALVVATLAVVGSPYLRYRVERTIHDYRLNESTDIATSYGERLFYWRSSIKSIEEAPLFGHGTGSTKQIFEARPPARAASGPIWSAIPTTRRSTWRCSGACSGSSCCG
jgi:O-antigen ligase